VKAVRRHPLYRPRELGVYVVKAVANSC